MKRHRITVDWGFFAFLGPFAVMLWFLAGIAVSSADAAWWILALWLVPTIGFCVRWLVVALVDLEVIEIQPRLWSDDERERHEHEAGL